MQGRRGGLLGCHPVTITSSARFPAGARILSKSSGSAPTIWGMGEDRPEEKRGVRCDSCRSHFRAQAVGRGPPKRMKASLVNGSRCAACLWSTRSPVGNIWSG
jgi:hypothetical protein